MRRTGGTVGAVSAARRCWRTACGRPAVTTLTSAYADQTAVVGPLATYAEPHSYDLCEVHGERLSAPRGWEVMRLGPGPSTSPPAPDDPPAPAGGGRGARSVRLGGRWSRRPVPRQPRCPPAPGARQGAAGTCACSPRSE